MTERKDEQLQRIDAALEDLARSDAPEPLVQDTLNRCLLYTSDAADDYFWV